MTSVLEPTVVGRGVLADAIASLLDPGPTAVLVVAGDGWDTRGYPGIRKSCAERQLTWLPVRAELGRIVIGPAEIPGAAGCVRCAETRRDLARDYPEGHLAVWNGHGAVLAGRPALWLTGLAAAHVAAIAAREATVLATDPERARTLCAMVYIDLETLAVTTHRFLPDPDCPECGSMPADTPALANITPSPRVKPAPDVHRIRPAGDIDALADLYVDRECGLVRTLSEDSEAGLMIAAAPVNLRSGTTEGGYGRTRNYRSAKLVALLEALERYGGTEPSGKRTVVHGSYRDLCEQALDPRSVGLYPPERYELPGFPYQPFDEAADYRWVWGYSFARGAPVLVPESLAYYRAHHHSGRADRPLVYEISNGCALGSCIEEAILYGLLEIAERDAFLMTWYTRMAAPEIHLDSAADRAITLIAEGITAATDYRVAVFDTTMEQGIPCVWAMAVNPFADDRPKAVCAAGSHLVPERAVENALSELGPILTASIAEYPAKREQARAMAADPSSVKQMGDHHLLYGLPDVFDRLSFLTGGTGLVELSDLVTPAEFRNADLTDDLLGAIGRYLNTGLDVVAVDQTSPEHRVGGFSCVKVIIPGTLPMTFGHDLRRVDGLPRLYDVPGRLGRRSGPLSPGELNPHPHPFP